MADYIEIQNSAGETTAYLSPDDGIKETWIDTRLNAESTLTFLLPLTSEKWSELTPECRIIVDNREFTILRPDAIDVQRDQTGTVWGKVMAHESWKLLDKETVTVSNDPQEPVVSDLEVRIISGGSSSGGYSQGSAGSALSYLLANSSWSVDTVDVTGTHDLETEKLSLLENIQKVQEIWGGYLVWDSINKTVSLRDESTWKNYTGFQVRYAKNLKHITRTDNNDITTRLYPFGEDDLDIASVNGGIKYLDNNQYTNAVYISTYINQEISDPQELMDKAIEVLDKISQPRYTYRIGVVDLRTLPEYSHETFSLGDMADVIDSNLNINIQARIQRHRYDVFQPWECELEIGEPEERLAAKLADSFNASRFVLDALRPNPTTSNILKGFINTFATTINSANGKLVWDDSTLQAIEIDGNGAETGQRVRITPGGIGVSTDGGQTYATAMTGLGVLANKVIVNELYALSTDDGFTKIMASGLHVFDETQAERLIAGWWMDGTTKRFGLNVKADDGATTLLDDRGIMQTWQEGRGDNVDSTYPLVLNIYLPPETRSIKRALLRFKLLAFRAYETGAASGGGTTSGPSSRDTTVSGYENLEVTTYVIPPGSQPLVDYVQSDGDHSHGLSDDFPSGTHNHGNPDYAGTGQHSHSLSVDGVDTHTHWLYNHYHSVTINGHSHEMDHDHSIPNHTHGLVFGIYTSTVASGVTVKINGTDRTVDIGGPFNADQEGIDISPYLVVGQFNTIELGSSQLGRIDATVFIQSLMGV